MQMLIYKQKTTITKCRCLP